MHIPYKCNRAAIFVSDQYHVSEPFQFKDGLENHRVNLTLLFGDRLTPDPPKDHKGDSDWDLFE